MADKDDKKPVGFDPKPVQVGGESILDRLLPHMKKIVIALVVTSVILGVVFFFIWLRDRKRAKETDQLAEVLDIAKRPVREAGQPADPKEKEPSFADQKERANAVLDTLGKNNPEGAQGTYKAAMLMQADKYDDAIAEYKKSTTKPGLDGVLAREGLGMAQERKAEAEKDPAARQKGLEEALATFNSMQPEEAGPRHAYALYHQGRILGLLGKKAEAKAALEKAKAAAKDENSQLVELVDERLVALGA